MIDFPDKASLYQASLLFVTEHLNINEVEDFVEEKFPDQTSARIYSITCHEENNVIEVNLLLWIWTEFVTILEADNPTKETNKLLQTNLNNIGDFMDCNYLIFKFIDDIAPLDDFPQAGLFDRQDMSFIKDHPIIADLIIEYRKENYPCSRGIGRITFINKKENVVYKIPLRDRGVKDNLMEAQLFEQGDQRLAACKITTIKNNIPILEMELLELEIPNNIQVPKWALDIEQFQVGIDQNGCLKAFDLY